MVDGREGRREVGAAYWYWITGFCSGGRGWSAVCGYAGADGDVLRWFMAMYVAVMVMVMYGDVCGHDVDGNVDGD